VAIAHQFGEHLGTRHHRDAALERGGDFRVGRVDALDTTSTSAVAAFSARWPTKISAPNDSRRSVTGEA
jgi:hypothetical protein